MIIDRALNAQKLWDMLLPHVAAPEAKQFVIWANRFGDEILEKVLIRVSRKFPLGTLETVDRIHRYTTGLLINLETEVAGKRGKVTPKSQEDNRGNQI
jgi:hypothetical protein